MPSPVSPAERTIPNDSRHDVVSFNLLADGQEIDATFQVMAVSVTKETNRIPTARIVIRDGSPAQESFPASETDKFIPGKEIEIKVGRDGHNETIFKGLVIKHSLKARQDGTPHLHLECKDKSLKLTLGRQNRYFEDMKDSDAIQQILGGLAGTVETSTAKRREIVQYNSTDWDFILSRAEMNGQLVFASDGRVDVKKPDTGGSNASVITLTFGANLLEFESEMDAGTQWKSVEASAWDYSAQALATATASSSGSFAEHGNLSGATLSGAVAPDKLLLRHSGFLKAAELQAWAESAMLRSRLSKICGRAKIIGFAGVTPGTCITLQGLGARFNGKAYVTAVRHEVHDGIWQSDIQFGLSAEWFYREPNVVEAPAGGLLPAIHGLQIGKVVQLENDPDGEDRILVRLPLLDANAQGIWSRLATLDAGNKRGTFFRPEIDDEVIVGFVNDDPRDAVVLGMLHSSAKPNPVPAQDTNHIKGLVTRSEMKILFDDEKKIITIRTPAENQIILSEDEKIIHLKDQNGNEIKMSADGILIKSPKDINIEATGKISLKATQDLTAEGLNTNIKASANLKAEGTAGAELSSTAIAKVKGGTVMIN